MRALPSRPASLSLCDPASCSTRWVASSRAPRGRVPRAAGSPAWPVPQSGCMTRDAPARIHRLGGVLVRTGPAKTNVGPRTVVV
eukprot:6066110-Prymnesium_polylepis.1